ncbi:hypothetical protein [Arthrobacter sp. AQ5-05]|uniref:hypothetical protein n=1 Tax=Arthrobacter sp. AQ5-05 TaxID=2184581 RepID=UPI0011BDE2B2|nr:hypothetical protein [Arthrobacter sp. AQ5-05]
MSTAQPAILTLHQLERRAKNRATSALRRLRPLIVDEPERTPHRLQRPYSRAEWRTLPEAERVRHARKALQGQAFDRLVAEYRIIETPDPAE